MRIKKILPLVLFLAFGINLALSAQYVVTGKVKNAQSGGSVEYVSATLLKTDSTVVTGVSTNEDGDFKLTAKSAGNYIVRLSYVGYTTVYKNVALTETNSSVNVGTLTIKSSENVLGTAVVSTTVARVEQVEDTTVFNAAAYRVPEGSTLETLVKQLPGVEVSDDGTITWNGKEVSEFLINGKDFFKGDTQIAMKNLPTNLVSKIKAYDKASDYTEQTGIDDGEETTVLDLITKRELNESWITNIDLGYGSEDRYTGKIFATRITDNSRITAFGSANNVNDRGFGGPSGFGGGGGGLTATKQAGLDFSWDNGKQKREAGRLEIGGNVRYGHTGNDLLSTTSSETFLSSTTSTSSFSESASSSGSSSTSLNASLRLQWNPDSMTSISFRPSYSHSHGNSDGNSRSATFNDDPYDIADMYSPLDSIFAETVNSSLSGIAVNRNRSLSLSTNNSNNVEGQLNITRRLNSAGRNVSLRASAGYSQSRSKSFSQSEIKYYNSTTADDFLNQYSTTPSKNWNYDARLGYVEPLGKKWYAELRYQYSYSYRESNRSLYDLYDEALGDYWYNQANIPPIGSVPTTEDSLNWVRDINNSQYATYKTYDQSVNIGVRYNSDDIRFNAGVELNPQTTKMAYQREGQGIDTLITRNVFNVSPQIRFRYNFSKTNRLDIRYRGSSSQPSMTDLLAVVDDSNPLTISMGNPGLKPSWTNTLRASYNAYNADYQRGMNFSLNVSQTRNSVSSRVLYDESTGVRYTRPENINGNWSGRADYMFNTGLGASKLFTISTYTNLNYSNSVGYISSMDGSDTEVSDAVASVDLDGTYDGYNRLFSLVSSDKNTTRSLTVGERLNASYRSTWFDVSLEGSLNYQHARATLQESANMDTWNYSYGASANFTFDWGMSISTDIRMSSRRGYASSSMNTDELIWNAQISQSFLKNKAATISLQFYDILQEQSNVSRTLTASMRSDSWTNAINSYFMVHLIYRLNLFNGSSRGGDDDRRGMDGPPDGPGGMPPGGGGGMPPGGGGGGFGGGGPM
ncbi:MAG: outer membrane beta-barrel protein [Bacteroidales bacterium]|nr:outer membrane beta-barrel protein [Bacteroidales bacterium]